MIRSEELDLREGLVYDPYVKRYDSSFWQGDTANLVFDSVKNRIKIGDTGLVGAASSYSQYLYGDFESRRAFVSANYYGKWNGQNDSAFGMIAVNLSANPCVVADTVQVTSSDYPVMKLGTEYIGDERWMTNVLRVIPVFTHSQSTNLTMGANSKYTLNVYTYNLPHGLELGNGSLAATQTVTSSTTQFRFDLNITARFFRFELVANGPCEVIDLIVESTKQGLQ